MEEASKGVGKEHCQLQLIPYHSNKNSGAERVKRFCLNVQRDKRHCCEGMVSYESEALECVFF